MDPIQLTALLESWHIGDGNYPPLRVGQIIRLSFALEAARVSLEQTAQEPQLVHRGNAEYHGIGRVIWSSNYPQFAVIETGQFRFFLDDGEGRASSLDNVYGLRERWSLILSNENVPSESDPFFNLRVKEIRKVEIPERFITRSDKVRSYPTRVKPESFERVEKLETMEGQKFDSEFYLIDLEECAV